MSQENAQNRNYYSFDVTDKLRVICLDQYEIGVLGLEKSDVNFKMANDIIRKSSEPYRCALLKLANIYNERDNFFIAESFSKGSIYPKSEKEVKISKIRHLVFGPSDPPSSPVQRRTPIFGGIDFSGSIYPEIFNASYSITQLFSS